MVRGAGFEPVTNSPQTADSQVVAYDISGLYAQIGTQISDGDCRLLARVVESWPYLSDGLKLAILAIVDASSGKGGAQ